MRKILVVGLKEPLGGVENAVLAYTDNFDTSNLIVDFAFVCGRVSFEERIRNGKAIYLPNRVKHPLLYRKKLKQIFIETKYDALWCNYSGLTNIDFLKEAKKKQVPIRIIHSHTSKHSWGNQLMKYLVPFFHNKNQKIVDRYVTDYWTCSKKSADFMFGKKLSQKAVIIHNTVDTDMFSKDENIKADVLNEFGISKDATVIGHVGRMCVEKNQCFLLDVFKEVLKINQKAVLLFVGDGELKDTIISYAKEIGIENSVIFTLSRKDIPRLLGAMDVFLLPSITEGFPVTVIEAQAANVPCVVSSEAVVKETDLTDTTRFVSLEENVEVWAKTVLEASNESLTNGAEKLKAAGFDSKIESEKIQKFFKGV